MAIIFFYLTFSSSIATSIHHSKFSRKAAMNNSRKHDRGGKLENGSSRVTVVQI